MYRLSAASLPAAWRWACCSAFIVSASSARQRSCWPRQARRLMPEAEAAAVATEVAEVAEVVVFAAAVSVAAVFTAMAGAADGVATQDRAAITAIARVG